MGRFGGKVENHVGHRRRCPGGSEEPLFIFTQTEAYVDPGQQPNEEQQRERGISAVTEAPSHRPRLRRSHADDKVRVIEVIASFSRGSTETLPLTLRHCIAGMQYMRATLPARTKEIRDDGTIVEVVI